MNNYLCYVAGVLAVITAALAGIVAESYLVFFAVLAGLASIVIMICVCAEHVCETLSVKQTETNQPVETEKS